MKINVLVVDDSRFYRNRLCDLLAGDPDIHVIGTAVNGREAVDKVVKLKPDVVTMDIEMPIMDGIAAVREIMQIRPVPVLMFSSLTTEGGQATLDALDAGAVDFMLKRMEDMALSHKEFAEEIRSRIRAVARRSIPLSKPVFKKSKSALRSDDSEETGKQVSKSSATDRISLENYKIIVIGASTGGPSAVQGIISSLPKGFPIPVLVIQHMPAAFTGLFARRIDSLSELDIKEAEDGDAIITGKIFIAPGGKQMIVEDRAGKRVIRIRGSRADEQYKPSVDVSFNSVSSIYGRNALAIVLTGMGADGREGAAQLKKGGSSVWAQDEQSCVVYGMPQAVVEAGLADRILPITEIARLLASGP